MRRNGGLGPPHRRAVSLAFVDQSLYALQLNRRDDRPDVGRFVERLADTQMLHAHAKLGVEALGDAFLRQQARSGAADLALVEPDGVDDAFHRAVEIGVLEHDERRFAAKLKRQFLARARRRLADQPADFGRSGEGDLVDAGMRHQGLARSAVARHDIDDAGRQARIAADFGEGQRGQRREFGGLQDDRIAGGQRRSDFPRQHQQREIPWDDLAADADRPLARKFRLYQFRPAGVMIEMARHERHVEIARFADRLAIVHALEHGEEAVALLNVAGERIEMARADMAWGRRP